MVCLMEQGQTFGLVGLSMKGILRMGNIMVNEPILGLMEENMKGNTRTEKDKVKGHTLFPVEISISI